jgi:hypothetical protein
MISNWKQITASLQGATGAPEISIRGIVTSWTRDHEAWDIHQRLHSLTFGSILSEELFKLFAKRTSHVSLPI